MRTAGRLGSWSAMTGVRVREFEFRRLLAGRLGEASVNSYVAYCRRVERELGADLDTRDLTQSGIAVIGSELRAAGVSANSLRNCLSAVRAYAELSEAAQPSGPQTGQMQITREQRERWAATTAGEPFNQWLDGQVKDESGRMNLARLHEVAKGYGIDRTNEYRHLNPGQQRMNLGNILRRIVPRALYDPSLQAIEGEAEAAKVAAAPPTISPSSREGRFSAAKVGELLAVYGEVMDELRARGVVRTGNSPVGDYAELLFASAFGWALEPNSAAGHDATDSDGLRYQIKGRRLATPASSRQLSAIRRLPERTFDHLAAVLFDTSFKVTRAILVPHEVVAARARRVEHTNSWTFILDDRVWREPGARDVTAEIAVAAAGL
jgi:hypothetical protein